MARTGATILQAKDTRSQKLEKVKAKRAKKSKTRSQTTETTDSKQADIPNTLCHGCKNGFTDEGNKLICCDRCELWHCIKCANISEAGYTFLASTTGEDIAWYCKPCKLPAKNAVLEDKSIEDKCKEYMDKINQRMKTIELSIKKKAEQTTVDELQKQLDKLDRRLKDLEEGKKLRKSWTEIVRIPEKKAMEEEIEVQLRSRENEEKDRQNRRNNIIVFGLPESKSTDNEQRKMHDIEKIIRLTKNMVNINEEEISKAIRLGKEKDRPLLITLKREEIKRELFKNLNKIRDAEEPFNKVTITHDLTKKQKDELKKLINQAMKIEEEDQSGEYIYRVRGTPWNWHIKKIPKRQ